MQYAEQLPCPALRARVDCYWTLRGAPDRDPAVAAPTPGAPHLVLPDGCTDVIWSFGDPVARPAGGGLPGGGVVVGPMTSALRTGATGRVDLCAVRFRPGEGRALLPCPPLELRDRSLSLDELWGSRCRSLGERLAEARSDAERFTLLDSELTDRAQRAAPVDLRVRRALRLIEQAAGRARVTELAAAVGLGDRQLERAFLAGVGLGPKTVVRALRLQALAGRLAGLAAVCHGARWPDWSALAAEIGFADQAHLVREVRALAGVTPTELARARGMSDSSNRRRIEAASLRAS